MIGHNMANGILSEHTSFVSRFDVHIFVSTFWKGLQSISTVGCVLRVVELWLAPLLTSHTAWCRAAPARLCRLCRYLLIVMLCAFRLRWSSLLALSSFSSALEHVFLNRLKKNYAEGQISLRAIWRGKPGRPAKRRAQQGVVEARCEKRNGEGDPRQVSQGERFLSFLLSRHTTFRGRRRSWSFIARPGPKIYFFSRLADPPVNFQTPVNFFVGPYFFRKKL